MGRLDESDRPLTSTCSFRFPSSLSPDVVVEIRPGNFVKRTDHQKDDDPWTPAGVSRYFKCQSPSSSVKSKRRQAAFGQSILHYIHYPHKVYRPRREGWAPCAKTRRTTNLNPSRKGREASNSNRLVLTVSVERLESFHPSLGLSIPRFHSRSHRSSLARRHGDTTF